MNNDKYIVVACPPRCGSVYMTTVLRELGMDIGHEEPGPDGVVGWQHLMGSHPWTMKALKLAKGREIVWLEQFRHPVPAIASMAARFRRGDWPPLTAQEPVAYIFRWQSSDSCLVKALKIYYYMNLSGFQDQKFNDHRYRIESIDAAWPWIAELIGLGDTALPKVPRDTNSHKDKGGYAQLGWTEIFDAWPSYAMNVAMLADKMGYVVNKAYLSEPDDPNGQMDLFGEAHGGDSTDDDI